MSEARRPLLELLSPDEVVRIIDQAIGVLGTVGVRIEHGGARELLAEGGARTAGDRVFLTEGAIRRAIGTAPGRVVVFDRDGNPALDLGGDRVHFDPGSSATQVLDRDSGRQREPRVEDCVRLAWVTEACSCYHAQSTALVPADVPVELADRFRLLVALRNSRKPVVTGTFRRDGFAVMRDFLVAVRGSESALRERPLAIFDCCPTPPLTWSDLTAQALLDCAGSAIPATLVSMPLGGATAPVTLREMVVQHCAESLSGLVLHQSAAPGAPILYGSAAAAFDMRHGTPPAGAIESVMVELATAQVGRALGLPTHGYLGVSDAKTVDWQAGSESSRGAVLAALAGIHLVAGPGILDFIGCQSLEKLILDHEACADALRLVAGIAVGSAAEAPGLLADVVASGHFLGHRHTRRNFRGELSRPGAAIDRRPYREWLDDGARDAFARAASEVDRILGQGHPAPLPDDVDRELVRRMRADATRLGVAELPFR